MDYKALFIKFKQRLLYFMINFFNECPTYFSRQNIDHNKGDYLFTMIVAVDSNDKPKLAIINFLKFSTKISYNQFELYMI